MRRGRRRRNSSGDMKSGDVQATDLRMLEKSPVRELWMVHVLDLDSEGLVARVEASSNSRTESCVVGMGEVCISIDRVLVSAVAVRPGSLVWIARLSSWRVSSQAR